MTTTLPSSLMAGQYATYDSPTTLILWAAAMVNFKTTNRLVGRARAYGMEVSTEKDKVMTKSTINISADISMNG